MKNFLHHFFVPHQRNNYRGKILHHSTLFVLILFLTFSSFSTLSIKHLSKGVLGVSYTISNSELLTYVNQARADNGLSPLVMNEVLSSAALNKGKDMFSKNYWAHFAPDGTSPWHFIKNSGYEYSYAGENLAKGFTNSKDVVDAWMASPTHRENLLSANYRDMGFAIIEGNLQGEDTVLVVQMFGSSPNSEAAFAPESNSLIAEPEPVAVAEQAEPEVAQETIQEQQAPQTAPSQNSAPSQTGVQAAFEQDSFVPNAIVDIAPIARMISIGLVSILLCAFILDVFIIERRKVPRLVGHNLDHLMLILVFLIVLITQGVGVIL